MNRINGKDKLVNNGRVEDTVTSKVGTLLCYNCKHKYES